MKYCIDSYEMNICVWRYVYMVFGFVLFMLYFFFVEMNHDLQARNDDHEKKIM